MKVLITGASGTIGRILTKALVNECSLALVDIKSPDEINDKQFHSIAYHHSFIKEDISQNSITEKIINNFKPDAIIHLAAILGRETDWYDIIRINLIGTINVFEISLSAKVDRVIYASSNNVYSGYEEEAIRRGNPLHLQINPTMMREDTTPSPDSRYAVAKLMVEEYAKYLSHWFGLRTFGLRIGTVREIDDPNLQLNESDLIPRFKKTWLTHNDLIQIVKLCLKTNVNYGIYNAISGIPGSPGVFIDVTKAIIELGYRPEGFNGKF